MTQRTFPEDLLNLNLLFSLILTHPLYRAYSSTCYSLFECLLQSLSPFRCHFISLIISTVDVEKVKLNSFMFRTSFLLVILVFFSSRMNRSSFAANHFQWNAFLVSFLWCGGEENIFRLSHSNIFVGLPLVLTSWRREKKKMTTHKCTAQ